MMRPSPAHPLTPVTTTIKVSLPPFQRADPRPSPPVMVKWEGVPAVESCPGARAPPKAVVPWEDRAPGSTVTAMGELDTWRVWYRALGGTMALGREEAVAAQDREIPEVPVVAT